MKAAYWLAPLGVALAAGVFSWLNRGERVIVHMGITTFYRAPLTLVLFLSFLAGMLAMMALSLRHDMRVRDELRARGLLDGQAPRPADNAAHARVDPYENGNPAPWSQVAATTSHPPFAGDGAAHRHDVAAGAGDGDATRSHIPLVDRTAYRPDHRAGMADGDGARSHPPFADRIGHGPDHPAGTADGDVTRPHPPFANDGAAYGRDEPAARDDGDSTFIHRREGEPPTA